MDGTKYRFERELPKIETCPEKRERDGIYHRGHKIRCEDTILSLLKSCTEKVSEDPSVTMGNPTLANRCVWANICLC